MTTTPKQPEHRPEDDFVPTDELIRRQEVQPIVSANDLVTDDPFASDDDYADFLADLRASRQSSISSASPSMISVFPAQVEDAARVAGVARGHDSGKDGRLGCERPLLRQLSLKVVAVQRCLFQEACTRIRLSGTAEYR